MNCQRFENVVSELARGQMMAAELRSEALAHCDACENCAARLRDEEMLTRGLQSLAAEMKEFAAPAHIESTLLETFRARQIVVPISTRRSSSRYWLVAVAAVLLIVMSVIAVRLRGERDNPAPELAKETLRPEKHEVSEPSDEAPKKVQQAVNYVPKKPSRKPYRNPASRRSANPTMANHVANEIATDFFPLSYMDAANLQDGGQIVRMELPRSALARFGLPVNMDRYNEKVKADVVFGVDGLAHAIRFVQTVPGNGNAGLR